MELVVAPVLHAYASAARAVSVVVESEQRKTWVFVPVGVCAVMTFDAVPVQPTGEVAVTE